LSGDLLGLLGDATVSVVDGFDLAIKIPSTTASTDFSREAVNAHRSPVLKLPQQDTLWLSDAVIANSLAMTRRTLSLETSSI